MLSSTAVFEGEGLGLTDVACRHPVGRGRELEPAPHFALVFIRRGCFVRTVAAGQSTLDATVAYAMNHREEQRFDHPNAGGDDCTVLSLDPRLVASLYGGDQVLPTTPLPVSPRLDLVHRILLAQAALLEDRHALVERALLLSAELLETSDARRVGSGHPQTVRRRRVLVDEARQALAGDPDASLLGIARSLSVSPHHLSRVFRSITGETVARHRMRIRVRDALERLAGGERDLARVAAEVGFSDESHLSRVMRRETGGTPAALRRALQVPDAVVC